MAERTLSEMSADLTLPMSKGDAVTMRRLAAEMDALGTIQARGHASNARGAAFYAEGKLPEAIEQYKVSVEFFLQINNTHSAAAGLSNIGAVYFLVGDFPASIEHNNHAMRIYEESNDLQNTARLLNNTGGVLATMKHDAEAMDRLQRASAIYQELGERRGYGQTLLSMMLACSEAGKLQEAISFGHRAKEIFEEVDDAQQLYMATSSLVDLYIDANELAKAEDLLHTIDESNVIFPSTAVQLLSAAGRIAVAKDNFDLAKQKFTQALERSEQLGMRSNVAVFHRHMRDLALKQNDFAAYVLHNDLHIAINDEVKGQSAALKFAMIEKDREMLVVKQARERERTVLYSTLPKHIADRVLEGETVNDNIGYASVIFIDVVGFTHFTDAHTAEEAASMLNEVFNICDTACANNGIVKVKTIGDAYLAFSE